MLQCCFHLHGVPRRTVLLVPVLDKGHINSPPGAPRSLVEGVRGPVQSDAVCCIVRVEWCIFQERLDKFGELKLILLLVGVLAFGVVVRRDGVDERVEVVAGKVRVLSLDVDASRVVIHAHVHLAGAAVVKVRKRDAILCSDLLPNDDLVDVVEFIPVLLVNIVVAVQGFELGPSRDRKVERLHGGRRGGRGGLLANAPPTNLIQQSAKQEKKTSKRFRGEMWENDHPSPLPCRS